MCYKIDSNISIMSAELVAISEAIFYCLNLNLDKVIILTDSKSALQHLARCASGFRGVSVAYKILECLHIFNQDGRVLILQWVPSHIGLAGNEEADRLAKLATTEGIPKSVNPYNSELLPKVKSIAYNHWKEYFDIRSKEKGIWYKSLQSEPPRVPWFVITTLNRFMLKLAFRLRSGHYPSAKFAHLMKKADTPNCPTCGKIEDVQHLLMECVRNKVERESLLRKYGIAEMNVGIIQSVLSEPASEIAQAFYLLVPQTQHRPS